MRLHVTERPKCRQFGVARDACIFSHHCRWVAVTHDEHVQGQQFLRAELAFASSKVEGTERLMNEYRPAIRADQPLDRNTSTMRAQLIAALSAAHRVDGAFAIELWSAFTETEQRTFGQKKRQTLRSVVERHPLHILARSGINVDGCRISSETNDQIAGSNRTKRIRSAPPGNQTPSILADKRVIAGQGRRSAFDRRHTDAHRR